METRSFLVHCGEPFFGGPYVDVLPPSSAAFVNENQVGGKVLGRHSPELYWRIGNDPRCSRRMMSITAEELATTITTTGGGGGGGLATVRENDEFSSDRVHPHVAQRLVLKCLGKNTLTVVRSKATSKSLSQGSQESRFLLHQSDSITLRVGDSIGIGDKIWMQVVLAHIIVTDEVKEPVVLPYEEDKEKGEDAIYVPACRNFYPYSKEPPPPSVVRTSVAWSKLPFTVRSSLVHSVWKQQLAAFSRITGTVTVSLAGGDTPVFASYEEANKEEEAGAGAAALDPFAVTDTSPQHDMRGIIGGDGDTGNLRRQRVSLSKGRVGESQLISLDMAPVQKKRRASFSEGGGGGGGGSEVLEGATPICLVESNTYYDTYDERLDETVCALEKKAAVINRLITVGPSASVLLGGSPPPDEGSREPKKGGSPRTTSLAVSRTQLRLGKRPQQQQEETGHGDGTTVNPAGDESQVVYYRH
ncbi:putative sugar transporter [Trypanosoma theileri]|uniref:Putative sugar transporter n=1 Tax=Trypanosoma theileri TaxID=67003 RepID=A0A1X0PA01_9TRYP|nr:putative sugar transporter [Trypanosoma theileri]ORC93718.1 putative sugar transporter [Trypanosoma theileri]